MFLKFPFAVSFSDLYICMYLCVCVFMYSCTYVCTLGATTGIGKATSVELAKRGARLHLACRNVRKGEAIALLIQKRTGNSNVFAAHLDLSSFSSIKMFAEDFLKNEENLHVLINNAGQHQLSIYLQMTHTLYMHIYMCIYI